MKISEKVNYMIAEAKKQGASDIHFHPQEHEVKVYFKISGMMAFQKLIDLETYTKITRFLKFKTRLDISVTQYPQNGSYFIIDNNEKLYIRVSTIPVMNNESIVLRLHTTHEVTSDDLISPTHKPKLDDMKEWISTKAKLHIFVGPTASGKTTIINAICNDIYKETDKKVLSIENPIEIMNANFIQMQINEEMGIDYALGIKAALRQNPDILIIGEITSERTARNVYRAVMEGVSVVSAFSCPHMTEVVEQFKEWGFSDDELNSLFGGIAYTELLKDDTNKTVLELC